MSKISGIRDIDREILSKVKDKELLYACLIDKYTWNIVCDDAFLRRRLLSKYPQIEQYKKESETWKQFFRRAIYYIDKMKEEYGYEYAFGNFSRQYNLVCDYLKKMDKNRLLAYASGEGELGLVIWSLKIGASVHFGEGFALRQASAWGNLEVVKYLVKQGADINAAEDSYSVLYLASRRGYLEIVKYLVECGANITEVSLNAAVYNEHWEIVKYLVECGADITEESLIAATLNGHEEVVNFLKSVM